MAFGFGAFRNTVQRGLNPGVGPMQDAARRRLGMTPGVQPARSTAAPPVATADTGMLPQKPMAGPQVLPPAPPPVPTTGGIGGAAPAGIAPLPPPSPSGGVGGVPVGLSPMQQAAQRYGQNQTAGSFDQQRQHWRDQAGMGGPPGNRFGGGDAGSGSIWDNWTPHPTGTGEDNGGFLGRIVGRIGQSGRDTFSGDQWNRPLPNEYGDPGFGPGSKTAYDQFLTGQPDPQIPSYLEDIYNQTRQQEEGDLQKYLPSTAESPEEAQLFESLRQQSIADANRLSTNLAGTVNAGAAGRGLLGSGINISDLIQTTGGVGNELQSRLGELGRERMGSAVERRRRREDTLSQAAEAMRGRLGGLASGRYGYGMERSTAGDQYRQEAERKLFDLRAQGMLSEQEFRNQMAIIGKQRRGQQGRA